jgi:hypothetical protein
MDKNNQRVKDLYDKNFQTYLKKNQDYGDSFSRTYKRLGIISAVTRITDKYERLISLATKPAEERLVLDESITDTLLDLSNYAIMTVAELEREKEEANASS